MNVTPTPARISTDTYLDMVAANEHRIARTEVAGAEVSTVLLMSGRFETLVMGGEHDMWDRDYPTRDEAVAGHAETVAALAAGEHPGGTS